MRRLYVILAIAVAMVCHLNAAQVLEADAHQVADRFFSAHSSRLSAGNSQAVTRLAYKAEQGRFYVYDRGESGGFVVVAGDDRLPQVLGYGTTGDFSSADLPPAVQYWMDELDRQIALLQSHNCVEVHHPIKRATVVEPLLTTQWNQLAPYNNYCPTYGTSGGSVLRSLTGCVATAAAQVMNYHQWPPVGQGSHSYDCLVNGVTPVRLSADFSRSVYRWDLMSDTYDENSSEESCDAVARLMSDVGIALDMAYGSSSAALTRDVLPALEAYFGYADRSYMLNRDNYSAAEWDQILADELSARRPIFYGGTSSMGHAFVLDGLDNNGYYHVNWGWGGDYDGYYLVSLLNPTNTESYTYYQHGLFGVVPEPRADEVGDVLYVRCQLLPVSAQVRQGGKITLAMVNLAAEGNKWFDADSHTNGSNNMIPMSLDICDMNGVDRGHYRFTGRDSGGESMWSAQNVSMTLPASLEDGEYRIKLSYAMDGEGHYDQEVLGIDGQELYVRMTVCGDSVYLMDRCLSNTYSIDLFELPAYVNVNESITVEAKVSNYSLLSMQPTGNVYLSLLNDGDVVASSEMYEVMIPSESSKTYTMQITAPSVWGFYQLVMCDESGSQMKKRESFMNEVVEDYTMPLFVKPVCIELVEDFESMEAGSSTSDQDVQGRFTTWSFTKGGVRAPGEGRCHGTHSVMLKKGSTLYTSQPVQHHFIVAQATFFNPSKTLSKYSLEYSTDGGATWLKANTIKGQEHGEVPANSESSPMWQVNLPSSQQALFRIAMVAGGSGATYVDDVRLYYIDKVGDVNGDGEVNIADINAVIDIILSALGSSPAADVNNDGEVNVADINALIGLILSND